MIVESAIPIIAIVVAPFVGSFLAVVIMRLVGGRSIVTGRSACDACKHILGPAELIPLLSFVFQRGRCRHCGAPIDALHPVVEIGATTVAVWAAIVTSGWIVAASCILGWTLLTLAAIDWRTGLLPDILTVPLIGAGLLTAFLIDGPALGDHLIGAAAGFAGFVALAGIYSRIRGRAGLGLGDAKLLSAAGAWLSWIALPSVVLLAALFGMALVLVERFRGRTIEATSRVAFGPALAAATWLVWLYGPLVPG
ncbi:MAG: A24 family peptidase [Rhizomicrobium sp.]